MNNSYYSQQSQFDRELNYTFNKLWLFAGLTLELNDKNCILKKINNQNIILVKDQDKYFAYKNICPHRHNKLLLNDAQLNHISCKYHGWSFNLKGKCVDQPFIDKTNECNLYSINIKVLGKLIFINLEENPIKLEKQFSRKLISDLTDLSLYICDYKIESVSKRFNWKLMQDNLRDSLHPFFIHKDTLLNAICFEKPGIAKDIPETFLFLEHASYGGPDVALKEVFEDKRFINKWPCEQRYYNYFIYPNLHIACADNGKSFVIENYIPTSPSTTTIEVYYSLTENSLNNTEKNELFMNLHCSASKIYNEDFTILENIQTNYTFTIFKEKLISHKHTHYDLMIKRFHTIHRMYTISLWERLLLRLMKVHKAIAFLILYLLKKYSFLNKNTKG